MYFNQIDEKRASVLMSKLDGLVLKLCIDKFAKYDLQQEATENYATVLKRAIRYARDEAGERLFLEL